MTGKPYDTMTSAEKVDFLAGELATSRILVREYRDQIAGLRQLVTLQRRMLERAGLSLSTESEITHGPSLPRVVARPVQHSDADVRDALDRSLDRLRR